jgi:hypothetical protein
MEQSLIERVICYIPLRIIRASWEYDLQNSLTLLTTIVKT